MGGLSTLGWGRSVTLCDGASVVGANVDEWGRMGCGGNPGGGGILGFGVKMSERAFRAETSGGEGRCVG